MLEWMTTLQSLGTAAAALASIFGLSKYVYKPLRKKLVHLSEFYNNCSYMAKEMKPNGGSSLRDSVEGLKGSIDAILSTVVKLDQRQVAISQHNDKGIFESDQNGDFIFVNRAFCHITKRTPEEAYGRGWKVFICPEEREAVTDEWYNCVKERRDFTMTFNYLLTDGSKVKVNCHAYVLKDAKAQVIGYMGFVVPTKEK
jgi:PAS domain S-box-containing protein